MTLVGLRGDAGELQSIVLGRESVSWNPCPISMDATCSIVVIDDHRLIAEGCQSEFARAGLPWRVSWSRSLSEVQWPEGRTLVILDLRLNDDTRPAQVIGDLTDRPVPVVVYTSGEAPDLIRAAGRLDDGSRIALFKEAARDGLISYYE